MKNYFFLFVIVLLSLSVSQAQYTPAETIEMNGEAYSEGELRRFLLQQEKGTPVWKLARKSRTSHTVGVSTVVVGAAFLIAGWIQLNQVDYESLLGGINEAVAYTAMGLEGSMLE